MKYVYICSPLRGNYEENTKNAIDYCRNAILRGDLFGPAILPIAPHIYFTQFLDDTVPREREKGLSLGLSLLSKCDELWIYGKTISEGMKGEISAAARMNIPIITVDLEPTVVQELLNSLPRYEAFDHTYAVANSKQSQYEGKLLLLNAENLSPEHRDERSQYWVATGGNGCNPEASGRSVFCTNLFDGEKSRWYRSDFHGIADSEKLPDWAKEKLQQSEQEQGEEL